MKRNLLLLAILILSITAYAQKNGSVSGVLKDSVNSKSFINYATVSIYKAGDSILTNYKLSDEKGVFKILGLELGNYRIIVTAWQFKTYRKEVKITADNPTVDVGVLLLTAQDNMVEEIEIRAERPPVIVRKDTIEFNAESFKTLPTAVVEDLLKKLPGVLIGANGQIEVNGKAVSRILVDGKEFFGGDQQIATKNLPANIIDKIQVSDDIEAKRRDPDLLASEIPQVINLKLKKAIKQGAFGKIYAGGGINDNFEGGGIINMFRDTTQVSVLAYGNNVNKPGFTMGEIQRIGGFSRSGSNSLMMNSDGGFAIDNISFGGLGNGRLKSAGAGMNFNTLTKSGININGKYFFGQTNSIVEQLVNDNQTLGTDKLITHAVTNSNGFTYNHTFGGKMIWKIDSLTTLTVNPTVTLSPTNSRVAQQKESFNAQSDILNSAQVNSNKSAENVKYNIITDLYKGFMKPGRALNTSFLMVKSDNDDRNFNASNSIFYPSGVGPGIDQFRNNILHNFSTTLIANYSEPLAKSLTLSLILTGTYLNNENTLATFFRNPANQAYDIVVPNLTETVNQSGIKTTTRARLRWNITKDLSIMPAIAYSTINLENRFRNFSPIDQQFNFLLPSLNVRYKALTVEYTPGFEEPSLQFLQPVNVNTDPLFIQNGNASLVPAKSHRFYAGMYKYDAKKSLNYNFYANGTVTDNGIIMSRVINANGVQTSTPINADGIVQYYAGATITKDYKNKKNQFSISGGFNMNYNKNVVEVNLLRSGATTMGLTPRVSGRINLNDKIEFMQSYNLTFNDSKYEDNFFLDRNFLTHSSETELVIRYPKKFVFESNFKLQANNQQVAGFNNSIKLWNAGVTYLFMKNDRAQLKFSVNDLLANNVRRSVYFTDNSIRDVQTNNIGRYGLLTFTYNIQNFGGKVGGKERFFGF